MTWDRLYKSSSSDEIANVNCFTTTSYTYYKVLRINCGTDGHTVFYYRPEATRNPHNRKAKLKR